MTEYFADAIFLMEDGSFLLVEVESKQLNGDQLYKHYSHIFGFMFFMKQNYSYRPKFRYLVVYIGEIKKPQSPYSDSGPLIDYDETYLSKRDRRSHLEAFRAKMLSGKPIGEIEYFLLAIWPLAGTTSQAIVYECLDLAKECPGFSPETQSGLLNLMLNLFQEHFQEEKFQAIKELEPMKKYTDQLREEAWQGGRQEAWQEAWQGGRQEAWQEAKTRIARNLFKANVPDEVIKESTGLTSDQLEALKNTPQDPGETTSV
jgi:hypothetical protein